VRAEVISFKPNTSSDLIAVADEFTDIMKIASIGRGKGSSTSRSSMSAPEMPAKEVSPEFGFREASPSVAAAALAAIKTGTAGGNGRRRGGSGRGTGSRRPAQEPADEPAATESPSTAVAEAGAEEGRRRRRRRGGRGRGRARRDEETPTTVPAGTDEEIGWEEFDDLSQLDAAEPEREYSFEEADPDTLAELGIAPDEAGTEEKPKRARTRKASTDSEAAEKPRRTRTRKTASDGEGEDAPKRSRSRAASTATDDDAPAATSSRRRTRKSADGDEAKPDGGDAGEAGEGGEPQGIWGRFRSARKPRTSA
jgi:ribonuclease E